MKSSLLRTFFEWALITSVLMSVGFFVWYLIKSHETRSATSRIINMQNDFQNNRAVMAMLSSECQAYARTNADMARFLASAPAAAPSAAPATKSGGK